MLQFLAEAVKGLPAFFFESAADRLCGADSYLCMPKKSSGPRVATNAEEGLARVKRAVRSTYLAAGIANCHLGITCSYYGHAPVAR